MNNQRQSGMQANPLSYSDINAFFALEQVQPTVEEVSIICRMDHIALKAYSDQVKAESKKNSKK